jgi:TRAP-type mannitol/chloroaromatic compound transport system permease large subunit
MRSISGIGHFRVLPNLLLFCFSMIGFDSCEQLASFLTPPFGFALFYLRGVAPDSIRTLDIYRGVVPFVLIQLLALVVLWYLPELATWLPQVLYVS